MSTGLYKFDLESNKKAFEQYFFDALPSTNAVWGWYAGTGFFESDGPGKCVIWTSHANPLECTEPVAWIFDSEHRIRIYVSSEIVLDQAEFTPEAAKLSYNKGCEKSDILPAFYVKSKDQALFEQSKKTLEDAFVIFKEANKDRKRSSGEFTLVHGMNCLWSPVIRSNCTKLIFEDPCYKLIMGLSTFADEPTPTLPDGYYWDTLKSTDLARVQGENHIGYSSQYVEDCFRISACIRDASTDELAAWSYSHRDFYIGSLHVMDKYRRKGFGGLIVRQLCRKLYAHHRQVRPDRTKEVYTTATVISTNGPSERMFRKSGWIEYGVGVTWIGY